MTSTPDALGHEPEAADAAAREADLHAVAAPAAAEPPSRAGEPAAEGEQQAAAAQAVRIEPTTPTLRELELALAALDEIAPKGAVGEVQDALLEDSGEAAQVVVIRHASRLAGYLDWSWTVLLSRGLEGGPTVLEAALLPTETSLLAPEWVPWSERLADYLAAKEAAAVEGEDEELESDLEADLEDDFDDDFEDVDDDGIGGLGDDDEPDDDEPDDDEDDRSY